MRAIEQILPELTQKLGPLEQQRQATRSRRSRGTVIMLAVLACGLAWTIALSRFAIWATVVGGILTMIALWVTYTHELAEPYEAFRKQFKRQFISNLLAAVADEVRYLPDGDRQILQDYQHSELFTTEPDRETIEDSIFARIGQTDLKVSELHTEYKQTTTDSDGKTQTKWHTIFKGVFISADFHKDFRGKTFVRCDVAEKNFGRFARMLQKPIFSDLQLVQLEDPDFEREFKVQSTDQIEARYILSPSLMRRMFELKERFGSEVEFSFLRSRVHIAISTSRNFFEPRLGKSLEDPATLRESLDQVSLCMGIVEDLDLNTRIWSKR